MSMQSRAIVVTTIFPPTPSMVAIADGARAHRDRVFVAGDAKGPFDFDLDGVELLTLEDQSAFALGRLAPTGSYARKNIAYLAAMKSGATVILETDDDNTPRDEFFDRRTRVHSLPVVKDSGWLNVYAYFTRNELVWPRGFPLEEVRSAHASGDLGLRGNATVDAPIQQGLADGDPDVDAVFRMTRSLPVHFLPSRALALDEGVWCPFNSQNTTWFRDAFQLMYLPSYCSFRMTDIWRSFVAQRIGWVNGWKVMFHSPTVWQDRNEHDLLADFADEVPGYLNNARIAEGLMALEIPEGVEAVGEAMLDCYRALVSMDLIGPEEIGLLSAWLEESRSTLGI
jgi:hypothetical protein